MPLADFKCNKCEYEWEDFYNAFNPIPEDCPECKELKCAEKLITLTKSKGRVELSGHEFDAKMKEDTAKFKKEVYGNENKLANVIGESRYEKNTALRDKMLR